MKFTKAEKSWILYDIGNSAFILLAATIMPIYFNYLSGNAGVSSTDYLAYWGYAMSASTILVAVLGPILGTLADTQNYKKRLFLVTVVIGAVSGLLLGITHSWLVFILTFVLAKTAFAASLIFYDSMLTDITAPERMDRVSSSGYAWGYIGSCVPFVVCLGLALGYESLGLSFELAMLLVFVIDSVWWFACTVPLLKSYRQTHYVEVKQRAVRASFIRIGHSFKEIAGQKHILYFIIAFFFYIDGVYTIIDMATAYGQALGLDSTGLLLALLVTQIVAFPSALVFGRLSRKFGAEGLITVCIAAYFGIGVFAVFLSNQTQFWILAVLVGLFQGGIQALSRSYFAKIVPKEKSGEYFGILDICGKGAAFIGTALVSLLTQFSGRANFGVAVIPVMMLIGLAVFRKAVREYQKH